MNAPRRLLVDVREDENLRGFHNVASLYLISDQLRSVELYRLGGDAPDERTALQSFSFDTGLKFHRLWRLVLVDTKFDLYLSSANSLPLDRASIAARETSRRAIVALMFGRPPASLSTSEILLNGHDTAGIARTVIDELGLPGDSGPS